MSRKNSKFRARKRAQRNAKKAIGFDLETCAIADYHFGMLTRDNAAKIGTRLHKQIEQLGLKPLRSYPGEIAALYPTGGDAFNTPFDYKPFNELDPLAERVVKRVQEEVNAMSRIISGAGYSVEYKSHPIDPDNPQIAMYSLAIKDKP